MAGGGVPGGSGGLQDYEEPPPPDWTAEGEIDLGNKFLTRPRYTNNKNSNSPRNDGPTRPARKKPWEKFYPTVDPDDTKHLAIRDRFFREAAARRGEGEGDVNKSITTVPT